ncbi:unnamed protein product [Sphagnum troendelagicum]|uniref:Uncharacterized protein n=1 Tax=Sphagnum troendelagicum TaxID=128251 RepID=A0ABP0U2Z8_9BRYO
MDSNRTALQIFLRQKVPIKADEKDIDGNRPFSIAKEKRDYVMVVLLESYFERTCNKNKAYANTANAILVGAALLATVTFTACPFIFYIEFMLNGWCGKVTDNIKEPLVDTKLVKNARHWLNDRYECDSLVDT